MIELKDFRAGYKGVEKIRIDDLRIEPGRILGLLGRNGSGKSTFLKALVGIIPYEGHAILDKTETSSMSHRERARQIAYLPQQLSPVSMSVGTLAAHGRFARMSFSKVMGEKDREAVRHALEMTGLWEERHRSVAELSGGERQRAYLAMVLAQETEYLFLDEPAASRQRDRDHFPRPASERCVLRPDLRDRPRKSGPGHIGRRAGGKNGNAP